MADKAKYLISLLDARDLKWCKSAHVPGDRVRATHYVIWATSHPERAAGSYRCERHAREFAKKRGLAYPEIAVEEKKTMGQFVCDGTCAGNELGDCNHGDSNDGLRKKAAPPPGVMIVEPGFLDTTCEACGCRMLVKFDDDCPAIFCPPCGGGCVCVAYWRKQ